MNKSLTIGRLAREAEVNIETIRYYQRIGLLNEPVKPAAGYRVYPSDTINLLRFIKRAKQLGFKLQEIAELLKISEGQCNDVRTRAEEKRKQIDHQINDLKKLRKTLDGLIKSCQSVGDNENCPIIETLTG